nr:hypothetical protein [Tanacetum cinerariifolium]
MPVTAPILDATPKPASQKSNSNSKRKNRKTCFVCMSVDHLIKDCDYHAKKKAQSTPRNYAHRGNNKQHASFTHKQPPKHMVPDAVLTQSKPISITAVRQVSAAVPKIMVTRPRHAHSIDSNSKSPIRRFITRSPSPKTINSPPRVTAAHALVVSAAKDQTVSGKDNSNPLMADNLPKIVWYLTHHVTLNKELASPKANGSRANDNRRKGVVIRDPEEELTTSSIIPADTKSKDKGKGIMVEEPKTLKKKQQVEMDEEFARKLHAELNKDIDWDTAIEHVKQKAKEDPAVQRYQVMKKKPQTEAQARKNMIMYLKNVAGFRLDYFKGMSYDDIYPIFEAKFNSNIEFLLKIKEQMEEEESRELQSINETLAQKEAKRRKLNKEVEDLKRHLKIIHDEDDDVYTEATPLARKFHVVDYEIINLNNKPYYKIIRADGTNQLYISFLMLLKNLEREDLEAL